MLGPGDEQRKCCGSSNDCVVLGDRRHPGKSWALRRISAARLRGTMRFDDGSPILVSFSRWVMVSIVRIDARQLAPRGKRYCRGPAEKRTSIPCCGPRPVLPQQWRISASGSGPVPVYVDDGQQRRPASAFTGRASPRRVWFGHLASVHLELASAFERDRADCRNIQPSRTCSCAGADRWIAPSLPNAVRRAAT